MGNEKRLEAILRNSIGGPCLFPEEVTTPTNTDALKIEGAGQSGDKADNIRFQQDVMKMVKEGKISEEYAEILLKTLIKSSKN